jgi:hypothetical protein
VLARASALLGTDGFVVASVPNVAHASVRLALLQGTFPYAELGLLDRTHLRFFTRATLYDAFADAGLAIVGMRSVDRTMEQGVPFDATAVLPGVLEALRADPEAAVFQFVVTARPVTIGEPPLIARHMRRLIEELDAVRTELDRSRRESATLRQSIEQNVDGQAEQLRAESGVLRVRISTIADELQASTAREEGLRIQLEQMRLALQEREEKLRVMRRTRAWRTVVLWWKLKRRVTGRW